MKKLLLVTILLMGVIAPVSHAQEEDGLLIWVDSGRSAIMTELAADFTEEYGVEVTVQEIAMGDIQNNLAIAGAAGEGPDIIIGANDWIGGLVTDGAIAPIDLGDLTDDFSAISIELFTYEGEVYGLPFAVENIALIRNTDLVPEAPATWEDVLAVSAELVEAGDADYGFILPSTAYHYQPILAAYGGYIFGRDESGAYDASDVGIGSEGGIASAVWLEQMVEAGLIVPELAPDVVSNLFLSGDAAMVVDGPWALGNLRGSDIPYEVSMIPTGPGGAGAPFVGGQAFMISAFSENQLLAEAFLFEFMATEEAMTSLFNADPRPPAMIAVAETIEDEDLAVFQQVGTTGVPQPSIPAMGQVWSPFQNAMNFIITGELDAEAAFTQAATQIENAIAGE
jgi:maltose/maltodextrin transport system substrate-binding protein/arabinogalactan oligomer/maltooligosaccharide transport system substrate-binding protein